MAGMATSGSRTFPSRILLPVTLAGVLALLGAPPSDADDYFSIHLTNATQNPKITDDKIFVTAVGETPTDNPYGNRYFLKFDPETGNGSFVIPTTVNMNYAQYSLPLSSFPKGDGYYEVNMPRVRSGRVYVSIGNKLVFLLEEGKGNAGPTINEHAYTNSTIPNFVALWDKFEMSYLPGQNAYINTTAVDFFGLPLKLQEPEGKKTTPLGFDKSRSAVIAALEAGLTGEWTALFEKDASGDTVLRVLSPMQALVAPYLFDEHYLDTYVDFVWWYYAQPGHSLTIDCEEVKAFVPPEQKGKKEYLKTYDFKGTASGDTFLFTNGNKKYDVAVSKPRSLDVFACDGALESPDKTLRSVIAKNLCASMNRGLLPPGPTATIPMGKKFYQAQKAHYYKNNRFFTDPAVNTYNHGDFVAGRDYYNLYAKVLHANSVGGLYAFPYDDVGGDDSTLSNDTSYANVTILDMSDTVVPPPYKPQSEYTVLFGMPAKHALQYQKDGEWHDGANGTEVTLPNEFKIKYGPTGKLKEYTINVNQRSGGGLAASIQYPFKHDGKDVAYIGLPDNK